MNNSDCKIQLLDLYFSKFEFSQNRGEEDTEYSTSFKIEYAIGSSDDSKVRITIDTLLTNKSNTISLSLQTIGIFQVDKNDLDKETYEHLVKLNTVAIVFPYIRSQITLLTTQPGIMPIMLPPININALIESQNQ